MFKTVNIFTRMQSIFLLLIRSVKIIKLNFSRVMHDETYTFFQ